MQEVLGCSSWSLPGGCAGPGLAGLPQPWLRLCLALLVWDSTLWASASPDPGHRPYCGSHGRLTPAAQDFLRASLSPARLPTGAKPASSVDPWGVPPGASTHSSSTGSESWAAPQRPAHGAERAADAWAAASAAKPAAASGEPALPPLGPRHSPPPTSWAWGLCLAASVPAPSHTHSAGSQASGTKPPPEGAPAQAGCPPTLQALPAGPAPAPL